MIPRNPHPSGATLSVEGALRARGLRATMPRRVILDVVRATNTHPTAAFIFERVRRRLPRVSLGTVYRNLRRLAAEGLLQERVEATGLRFDPNVEPHDHFTCLVCGRVVDFPRRESARRGEAADSRGEHVRTAGQMGFEVLDRRVELYGRCRDCRRRGGRVHSAVRGGSLGKGRPLASQVVRRQTARTL
jgi:Fur family transcriptional regulator, peroxide stress response regulator